MPRNTKRSASREVAKEREESRVNLYDEVTQRIVSELEAGRLPWVQPWGTTGGIGPGLPRNALTTRPYSGVNILILWGAVIEHGWPSQSWLTFQQARQAGGCVRKGERGQCVVYADRFTPEAEKQRAERDGGEAKAVHSSSGSPSSMSRSAKACAKALPRTLRRCPNVRSCRWPRR